MTFRPTSVAPFGGLGGGKAQNPDDVSKDLQSALGGGFVAKELGSNGSDAFFVVQVASLVKAASFLRDDPRYQCTMLQVVSAVDFLPQTAKAATEDSPAVEARDGFIEVMYSLWSFTHKHQINLKVRIDRDNPAVPTLCDLFRSANWYERECYDLVGVNFENHPDLNRILLPKDWIGHPLRRDYVFPDEYNGMKVPL